MNVLTTKLEEVSKDAMLTRLQGSGLDGTEIVELDMTASTFDRGKLKRALNGGSFLFAILNEEVFNMGIESGDDELIEILTGNNVHSYSKHINFIPFLDELLGTPTVDTSNTVFEDFTVNVDGIFDNNNEEVEIKKVNPSDYKEEDFVGSAESETEEEDWDFDVPESNEESTDVSFEDTEWGYSEPDSSEESTNTEWDLDIPDSSEESTGTEWDYVETDTNEESMNENTDMDFNAESFSVEGFDANSFNAESMDLDTDAENTDINFIEDLDTEAESMGNEDSEESSNTELGNLENETEHNSSVGGEEDLGTDFSTDNTETNSSMDSNSTESETDSDTLDMLDYFFEPEDFESNIPSVEEILKMPTSEINLLKGVNSDDCRAMERVVNNAEFVIQNLSGHIKYLNSNLTSFFDSASVGETEVECILDLQSKNKDLGYLIEEKNEDVQQLRDEIADVKRSYFEKAYEKVKTEYEELLAQIESGEMVDSDELEDLEKSLGRANHEKERLEKENKQLRKDWDEYEQTHKKELAEIKASVEEKIQLIQKLKDDNEILITNSNKDTKRINELVMASAKKEEELKGIQDDLFFRVGNNCELDTAVQDIVTVPDIPIRNVEILLAGTAVSVRDTYSFLYNSLDRYRDENYIVIDLSFETYVDTLFRYQTRKTVKDWMQGNESLDDVLVTTSLDHVKMTSIGFQTYNDSALLKLDWDKLLRELAKREEKVIIVLGYMHTFANNILYNSFIQCCTAYIYAESSPTSLRSLLLRMQRFVGVTPDNTKIVRLVDTKVQRQCQKFLEVLGRTTDVCLLSDRNDTIKL